MATIKVKNLKKEKKAAERKKKGEKPFGVPVDVKGIAGGVCHAEPAPSRLR